MANITAPDTSAQDTAKDALLDKARGMNIKPFVETPKAGKYDDEVKTLLAVDEQTGSPNSIEILVPSVDDVKKYKRWFNTSAANFDRGARVVNGEQGVAQGDNGGVLLEFILTPKRHITKKGDAPAEAAEAEQAS